MKKPDFRNVPGDVLELLGRLRDHGHVAWLVGGAVRDMLLDKQPGDWDVLTDAKPRQITSLFDHVIPVGIEHGTVLVHTGRRTVEVTTSHQKGIDSLWQDLGRRDFTVNAIAMSYPEGTIIDPYHGRKDLTAMRLRSVGEPHARFSEDALRTLRAARLVSVYGFRLHRATARALKQFAGELNGVAAERIRDELSKLLCGHWLIDAFSIMRRTGMFHVVLPELLEGVRKRQNYYHRYDIYGHIVRTVDNAPKRIRVRLAALLHDIAKPRVRQKKDGIFHFYGHAKASAEMAVAILQRWRFPQKLIGEVVLLIENHMILNTDEWSDAAVRRLIARVGPDLLEDLLDLSAADRMSHTESSALLGELNRFRKRVREQMRRRPPLGITDLAITGIDVMNVLRVPPGPKVGEVLERARQLVLEFPEKNQKELLLAWISDTFAVGVRKMDGE